MTAIGETADRPRGLFERSRQTIGGIWHRFKEFLGLHRGYAPADTDVVFTKIDVEALKQQLKLADHAARFGKQGLPRSDSRDLDGPQKQVLQHLRTELAEGFRRTNTRLARLWSALRARDVTEMVNNLAALPERRRRECEVELRQLTLELEHAAAHRDRMQAELNDYRGLHGLREPNLKSRADRNNLLALTIFLALAQATANAVFFAEGATYGLAAGLIAAAALGVFDVLLHGQVGRIASAIRAPEVLIRSGGLASVVFLAFSIPFWNLGIVHLRNGVRLHGFQEGTEQWLPNLLSDPFGFTDFYSYALLVVGMFCSLSAAVTGFNWDEPIPRLRRLGRSLEEATGDVEDANTRIADLQQEAEEDLRDECEQERARIQHSLNIAESLYREIRTTHENLVAHVMDAELAFEALIQFYRDENLVARGDAAPAPAYFHDTPPFDTSLPLEVNLGEMQEFVERQRRIANRVLSPEKEARA